MSDPRPSIYKEIIAKELLRACDRLVERQDAERMVKAAKMELSCTEMVAVISMLDARRRREA